jgi:hypothetical protein
VGFSAISVAPSIRPISCSFALRDILSRLASGN